MIELEEFEKNCKKAHKDFEEASKKVSKASDCYMKSYYNWINSICNKKLLPQMRRDKKALFDALMNADFALIEKLNRDIQKSYLQGKENSFEKWRAV